MAPSRSDDRAEIVKIVECFVESWNRHDMDAFANLFAPDAEFVNVVGLWWKGRDEIRKAHELTHASLFKHSRLSTADVSVRFPVEDVAIARARWLLEGHVSPEGQPLPARNGILVYVMARTSGSWWIIDTQNTDIIQGELSRPQ